VPQIDTPLLLDILLGLVVLLFVPFGLRRGVAKEAMVSAGILLGGILAERFGQRWGDELATRVTLQPEMARFAASVAILFASTFLLGYGGGAALGPSRPSIPSRLIGGLLAAFNAGLILSYLLAWLDGILGQGAAVDDGIVGRALLRQTDLLLLGGAGVLLALTVVGWIVNAGRARRLPREHDGGVPAAIPARQRPVRLSTAPDAGKYEPGPSDVAPSGRFGPSLDATSPLATASGNAGDPSWGEASAGPSRANGHGRGEPGDEPTRFSASTAAPQGDDTIWSAWNAPPASGPPSRTDRVDPWPVSSSVGVTDDERCSVCRARVGPRDVFCPECGATL
jgi:uncharacterized membrane protein required for colicin V production